MCMGLLTCRSYCAQEKEQHAERTEQYFIYTVVHL